MAQASRFSQVCNVWAPMYRQATGRAHQGRQDIKPRVIDTAYDSLLAAWKDYLAHDNHGRPIVFIGHSQGAAMLIKLLEPGRPLPGLRKRWSRPSSWVATSRCRRARRRWKLQEHPDLRLGHADGCVIAYSTLRLDASCPLVLRPARPGREPAVGADSDDGPAGGLRQSGHLLARCRQPAAVLPDGRPPRRKGVRVTTPWVTYPGLYTAQCDRRGGASWLQVTATPAPATPARRSTATSGPPGATTSTT